YIDGERGVTLAQVTSLMAEMKFLFARTKYESLSDEEFEQLFDEARQNGFRVTDDDRLEAREAAKRDAVNQWWTTASANERTSMPRSLSRYLSGVNKDC